MAQKSNRLEQNCTKVQMKKIWPESESPSNERLLNPDCLDAPPGACVMSQEFAN